MSDFRGPNRAFPFGFSLKPPKRDTLEKKTHPYAWVSVYPIREKKKGTLGSTTKTSLPRASMCWASAVATSSICFSSWMNSARWVASACATRSIYGSQLGSRGVCQKWPRESHLFGRDATRGQGKPALPTRNKGSPLEGIGEKFGLLAVVQNIDQSPGTPLSVFVFCHPCWVAHQKTCLFWVTSYWC